MTDSSRHLFARYRRFENGKWGQWDELLRRDAPPGGFPLTLPRGGEMTIYPDHISTEMCQKMNEELQRNAHLFRQYRIQGCNEPRAHFLLHDEATHDFEAEQPGYKYGSITMKARPVSALPALKILSQSMQQICQVPNWNIGINPVYYRDGNDYMGFHADDDQGEQCIMAVLTSSPPQPRRIQIRPRGNKLKEFLRGDVQLELLMQAGDAYRMDGTFKKAIGLCFKSRCAKDLVRQLC